MVLVNLIDDPHTQALVGYEKYDVVNANSLADVLVELAPNLVPAMRHGGSLSTFGRLDEREKDVEQAARKAGLQIAEVTHQNEWVCVTAKKD